MQLGERITVAPCYRGIVELLPLEFLLTVQRPMFSNYQPFCMDADPDHPEYISWLSPLPDEMTKGTIRKQELAAPKAGIVPL